VCRRQEHPPASTRRVTHRSLGDWLAVSIRQKAPAQTGEGWLFEVKFDEWRTQLRKDGVFSALYGRNGGDLARRFPPIV